MSYLYILENEKGKHYIGITGLNPEKRLIRHNKGDVYSTKFGRPWKLICVESFSTLSEARTREKQMKSWKGGNALRKFLSRAAGSSNGRTEAFEAFNPGSNPGPAALERNQSGGVKSRRMAG